MERLLQQVRAAHTHYCCGGESSCNNMPILPTCGHFSELLLLQILLCLADCGFEALISQQKSISVECFHMNEWCFHVNLCLTSQQLDQCQTFAQHRVIESCDWSASLVFRCLKATEPEQKAVCVQESETSLQLIQQICKNPEKVCDVSPPLVKIVPDRCCIFARSCGRGNVFILLFLQSSKAATKFSLKVYFWYLNIKTAKLKMWPYGSSVLSQRQRF